MAMGLHPFASSVLTCVLLASLSIPVCSKRDQARLTSEEHGAALPSSDHKTATNNSANQFLVPPAGTCTQLDMKDPWETYQLPNVKDYRRIISPTRDKKCIRLGTEYDKFVLRCLHSKDKGWSFQATRKKDEKDVMLKVIVERRAGDPEFLVTEQRECIQRSPVGWGIKAPFLAETHDVFYVQNAPFFKKEMGKRNQVWSITDLPHGDLAGRLNEDIWSPEAHESKYSERLSEKKAFPNSIISRGAQIAFGLWELHKRNMIYRNLNLENILCVDQECSKLMLGELENILNMDKADPPESCNNDALRKAHACGSEWLGSANFLAPSIVVREKYGFEVDWWAFGVVMYRMLTGDFPNHVADYDDWEDEDGPDRSLDSVIPNWREALTDEKEAFDGHGELSNLLQYLLKPGYGKTTPHYHLLETEDMRLKMMKEDFHELHEHPIMGHEYWLQDDGFLKELGVLDSDRSDPPESASDSEENTQKRISMFWGKVCLKFAVDTCLCPKEFQPSECGNVVENVVEGHVSIAPIREKTCKGMEMCRTRCESAVNIPKEVPSASTKSSSFRPSGRTVLQCSIVALLKTIV